MQVLLPVLLPGISAVRNAWLWAAVFTLQAVLLVVAGIVRRDLVFGPGWNLASGLGAVFIGYALIGYPLAGCLHPQPWGS